MTVLTHGAWVALIAHVLFILLFIVLGAELMAMFNVGTVILYSVCLALIKLQRVGLALGLATTEVIAHAWVAVTFIGWESGFHYYLFCVGAYRFFDPNWRTGVKAPLGE